jgi:hypothetical protein
MKRKIAGWRLSLLPLVSPQRISNTMADMEPLVRKNLTR